MYHLSSVKRVGAIRRLVGRVTALALVCSSAVFAAAPPNNDFASARALFGIRGSVTGSNVDATKELGERNHAANADGHSVWYRWIAPYSGSVTISTLGSPFDTLLAAYTGTTIASLGATLVRPRDREIERTRLRLAGNDGGFPAVASSLPWHARHFS